MSPGSTRSCGRWIWRSATTAMPRPVCCMCGQSSICTARRTEEVSRIADEVSALVRQFKGSLAAEHGVGIARTEYMRGAGGRGVARSDARDQAHLRPEEPVQSRQAFQRRSLQDRRPPAHDSDGAARAAVRAERLAFAFKDGRSSATSSSAMAAVAAGKTRR